MGESRFHLISGSEKGAYTKWYILSNENYQNLCLKTSSILMITTVMEKDVIKVLINNINGGIWQVFLNILFYGFNL